MILKIYKDREAEWGWVYVDGVVSAHCNERGYGIVINSPADGDDAVRYRIAKQDKNGMPTEASWEGYDQLMTDIPWEMESGEYRLVKCITVELRDGTTRSYVCDPQISTYLLSDMTGRTIERL